MFAPLRVDVSEQDAVEIWQTFRGNEWDNKGERIGAGSGSANADVRVVGERAFYESRGGCMFSSDRVGFYACKGDANCVRSMYTVSPLSLLKNPMILIGILGLGMVVGMPYLLDNSTLEALCIIILSFVNGYANIEIVDPETKKEFEEQQKNSVLSGGTSAANPLQNFDMAAWMAGKTAKTSGSDEAVSSKAKKRG